MRPSIRGQAADVPPVNPETTTVSPLDEYIASALPQADAPFGSARTSLKCGGLVGATSVTGVAKRLVMVARPSSMPAPVPGTAVVLSIDVRDGAVRVDQPAVVVACSAHAVVLRVIDRPLVLRRRVVHDQAIAEALGVRSPAGVAAVAA